MVVELVPGERPIPRLGRPTRRGSGDITAALNDIESLGGISDLSLQLEDLLIKAGASALSQRYLLSLDFLLGLHGLLKVTEAVKSTIIGQDSICELVVERFLYLIHLLL